MKRWIIIISIVLILIAGCIFEGVYTNKSFDYLEERLEVVALTLTKDKEKIDTPENIKLVKDLHQEWHERLKFLRAFIWHSSNKDIEIGLARAEQYIIENNYTEAVVEIYSLIHYSKHYSDDFRVSLENIF